MRGAVFVGPVLAFFIARRWCIGLQRADQARLLHGYESGIIMRSPEGAYAEKHVPVSLVEAYELTARERDQIAPMPAKTDENGVANHQARLMRLRARLSRFWFEHNIQTPTRAELDEAHHHSEQGLDGSPAQGRELESRRDTVSRDVGGR
jgi:ubiquinol-cytochrome c reductase cytochrome b subunit